MSKVPLGHKYGYKFGNTDRGILLSILMASLFLVAVAGSAAIEAAGPLLSGEGGVSGSETTALAGSVAVGIGVTLFSQCFEIVIILIVLTIISYIIYRLMSWLEEKCRDLCKCKWYKPWCCVGKLFCWMVTITKWVALVVTVILAVATVVVFIYCIVTTVAAALG